MTSSNRKMRGPALPLAPCSAVSRWPRRFPSPMPASAPSIAHCRGVEGRARTRSTGAARMTSRPSASVAKRPVSSPLRWRSQTSSWRHGRSGVSSRFTRAWAIRGSWSISVTSRRTPLGNRVRRGQTHSVHGDSVGARPSGEELVMRRRSLRRAKNAGAFLSPVGALVVPMHTLSDDYEDHPTYPEDERVPEPMPPSLAGRLLDRLFRRSSP